MKRALVILILTVTCLLSFAENFEQIRYDLGDIYYDQDIIGIGIDQSYDFYFPIVYADSVKDARFKFFYEFTQISGPDSMYVLMVNEMPVITDYFKEQKGEINISIPSELIEINTMARITLHITLDYSVCDQLRLNKNALWFRLKKESFFEFAYSEKEISSIPLFLSPMNPDKKYELIVDEPQKQSQASVAIAQYMGYLSSGLKRELEVRQSASGLNNTILFKETQSTFSLTEKTIHLPEELEEQFVFDYLSIVPSSSMTVTQINYKDDKTVSRSFSQLGINDFRADIVYNNTVSYPFTLDSFKGVPENAVLDLRFSTFNMLRSDGYWLNLFLNGNLIKSINLGTYDSHEQSSAVIKIPSEYFRAYNTFTFEMENQKSDCDEFSLIIHGDSRITFDSQSSYQDPYLNEFPYTAYSQTIYVVSDYSTQTASNLVNLAYEKGRVSTGFSPPAVMSLEEFLAFDLNNTQYNSVIFLIHPEDFYALTSVADLNDSFSFLDKKGEVLFKATTDIFDVAYSFNYETLPAIVFTSFGKKNIQIDEELFEKMTRTVSDFALFSEAGAFAFEVSSDELTVKSQGEEAASTSTFWGKNRLWIVFLVVVIVLFILLSSYKKTSKGR
ncbi:MAG: cellulose biosynthesis cyclic di-GMP-binding regulatory protein BcsB [Thermotogota bacterium]|nr:cellulose biosynthesis cyclic di-GMP-binding regulatory protein BcsB [Thermotogota bacterium]